MIKNSCKVKSCQTIPQNDKYKGYCSKHKHLVNSNFPDEAKSALNTLSQLGITIDNAEERYNNSKETQTFSAKGLEQDEIELLQGIEDSEIKDYVEKVYLDDSIDYPTFEMISVVEPTLDEKSKKLFRESVINHDLMNKMDSLIYDRDDLSDIISAVAYSDNPIRSLIEGVDLLLSLDHNKSYQTLKKGADLLESRLVFSKAYHNGQELDFHESMVFLDFRNIFDMSKIKDIDDKDFKKLSDFDKREVDKIVEAFNDSYSEDQGEYMLGDSDYGDLSDSIVERLNMDAINTFCYHGGDLDFESASAILIDCKY